MDPTIATLLRQRGEALNALQKQIETLRQAVMVPKKSAQDYIDSIPGRRVFYMLTGSQTFTTTQDGIRGNPINMQITQDGPFIMTHFPICIWRPSLPSTATNLGRWRPVYSWPLVAQILTADIVDISYEITDGGAQRNFQNLAVPPLLSRPNVLHKLPVHTLFAPNSTVSFTPTYHNVSFGGATPTTEGTLVVACPGYRIVNM